MIFIVSKYMIPKGFRGLTIYPFIIVKNKNEKLDNTLLNHENIHIRQQIELAIIPFFLWYLIEYLIRLVQYKDRQKAYRNISFEREAYTKEKDLEYLKSRSLWNFIHFIFKN
jgi:hypothetical protein